MHPKPPRRDVRLRDQRRPRLTRIETRYYAGARHELLNGNNRDEVTGDVLGWAGKTV